MDGSVSVANYSHEDGGGKGKSVCIICCGLAGVEPGLRDPCINCGKAEANYPLEAGGKGKKLCGGCAKDKHGDAYEPQPHKMCDAHGKRYDTCFLCCPSEELRKDMCTVCRTTRVSSKLVRCGEDKCAGCRASDPEARAKKKIEHFLRPLIEHLMERTPMAMDNWLIGSGPFRKDCVGLLEKKRKSDFLFSEPHCFVNIEIDEDSHLYRYCARDEAQKVVDTTTGIRASRTLKGRRAPYVGLFVRINPDAFDGKPHVQLVDRVREAIQGEHGALAFLARVQEMSARFDAINEGTAQLTPEEEKEWNTVDVRFFFYHSNADANVAEQRAEFEGPMWRDHGHFNVRITEHRERSR